MTAKEEQIKTKIVIFCRDNTRRIINVIGNYNIGMATSLGKDLERGNFKYASVSIL